MRAAGLVAIALVACHAARPEPPEVAETVLLDGEATRLTLTAAPARPAPAPPSVVVERRGRGDASLAGCTVELVADGVPLVHGAGRYTAQRGGDTLVERLAVDVPAADLRRLRLVRTMRVILCGSGYQFSSEQVEALRAFGGRLPPPPPPDVVPRA